MNAQTPLPPLDFNLELTRAALDHNIDLGTNGITGHTGSGNIYIYIYIRWIGYEYKN